MQVMLIRGPLDATAPPLLLDDPISLNVALKRPFPVAASGHQSRQDTNDAAAIANDQ